jgi:hypothetical protein
MGPGIQMTTDLIAWATSEGRRLDRELERLADRRLAVAEIARAAVVAASDARSLTCSPDELLGTHREDPAAKAGVRSLFARALGEFEENHDPTKPEEGPE